MTPTAIAREIGVAPSTLNKVAEEGDKHTHVLSTPTLYKLKEFRQSRIGKSKPVVLVSGVDVDPPASLEEIEDILKNPEMWMWISILRRIKKEDRDLLSELIRRWVVPPRAARKA